MTTEFFDGVIIVPSPILMGVIDFQIGNLGVCSKSRGVLKIWGVLKKSRGGGLTKFN